MGTVALTPHAEELLRDALARNPGQSAAEVVEQALDEHIQRHTVRPDLRSMAEFEAGLDRLAAFGDKIPQLPDEAFTRESFYRDHP